VERWVILSTICDKRRWKGGQYSAPSVTRGGWRGG